MAMKMLGGTSKFYYMDEDQKDIVSIQRESDYVEALQSAEPNTQLRLAIAQTQREARILLQPRSDLPTERVSSGTGQLCGVQKMTTDLLKRQFTIPDDRSIRS